jgi:hypothetical protein
MIRFTAIIEKFAAHGDKTGWSYIRIPEEIALQIKSGTRKSFKVKGLLDSVTISALSLLPMGEGDFLLALKTDIRKKLGKGTGAMISAQLEEDCTTRTIPEWLIDCLEDEPEGSEYFYGLNKSNQDYFIKWIESAKTETTKTHRLALCINAFIRKMNYGEMIRAARIEKL